MDLELVSTHRCPNLYEVFLLKKKKDLKEVYQNVNNCQLGCEYMSIYYLFFSSLWACLIFQREAYREF